MINRLFFLMLFWYSSLFAQQFFTVQNLDAVPTNASYFPIAQSGFTGYFSIAPLVPSVAVSYDNSLMNIRTLLNPSSWGDLPNKVQKISQIDIASTAHVELLQMGVRVAKNHSIRLHVSAKVSLETSVNKEFVNLVLNGNAPYLDKTVSIKIAAEALAYQEYLVGYTGNFLNSMLSIGANIKYLNATAYADVAKTNISLYTHSDDYQLDIGGKILVQDAYPDFAKFKGFTNNHGFALDFGAKVRLGKFSLSLQGMNFGAIWFKDNAKVRENFGGTTQFAGVPVYWTDAADVNPPYINTENVLLDLANQLIPKNRSEIFHVSLPARLNFEFAYHLTPAHRFSLLYQDRLHYQNQVQYIFGMGVSYTFTHRYVQATIGYHFFNKDYKRLGVGFAVNMGPLQWHLLTENVLGFIVHPMYHAELRTGFSWTFGWKKRQIS